MIVRALLNTDYKRSYRATFDDREERRCVRRFITNLNVLVKRLCIVWSMEIDNRLGDVDGKVSLLINVSSELGMTERIDQLEKILSSTFAKVLDLLELPPRAEDTERASTQELPGTEGKMEDYVRSRT